MVVEPVKTLKGYWCISSLTPTLMVWNRKYSRNAKIRLDTYYLLSGSALLRHSDNDKQLKNKRLSSLLYVLILYLHR
jgi:hypothetical protein